MEFLAAGVSTLVSLFILALFIAGVMKLFQIHVVLTEIKDGQRSGASAASLAVRRTAEVPIPLHEMTSGDEMLRALDAQMKWDGNASRSETSEMQQER